MPDSPFPPARPTQRRETTVRTYQHSRDLIEDQGSMAGYGYEVTNTIMWRPRPGYWRLILLGFVFAYLFPPRPELVVTYSRWR